MNTSANVYRPDMGHTANGSCQVCGFVAGDFFITKTITAPRAGKLTAQMYAKSSDSSKATIAIDSTGGTVSTNTQTIGTSFGLVTGTAADVAEGAPVTLKVGVAAAPSSGMCIVVDDIVETLN